MKYNMTPNSLEVQTPYKITGDSFELTIEPTFTIYRGYWRLYIEFDNCKRVGFPAAGGKLVLPMEERFMSLKNFVKSMRVYLSVNERDYKIVDLHYSNLKIVDSKAAVHLMEGYPSVCYSFQNRSRYPNPGFLSGEIWEGNTRIKGVDFYDINTIPHLPEPKY